ncbi:MAG: undecaprenyl-diphosphate phosphatase [Frateuria sp.]|nr:undecaprenyl-diphosphate phosphatase [Frateuria sp.]NUR21641.1 undecaprenyl-diphosphate phosphatase [Frateuria sp.]
MLTPSTPLARKLCRFVPVAGTLRRVLVSDLVRVILLGIIEGITEFLPISSTGHLLIAEKLGLGARSDLFNVGIQAGAILAVTLIYWRRLWELLTQWRDPINRDYLAKLTVAFLITAVLGYIAVKHGFKLPETVAPVAWALVIGGLWMLGAEALAARQPDRSEVTWRVAILVGIAQMIAGIFPGTSRSAATIFAALLAGTSNRAAATEFAFLVGIPTMYAASGYELLKVLRGGGAAHEDWNALALGFVVSAIVAFIAVKWLLGYIRSHRYTPFAIYRIALGVALLLWLPVGG